MIKELLALALALQAMALAAAEPSPAGPTGVGVREYPWQALPGEANEALERQGDRRRGERLYALCRSCHLPSASGSSDGSVPRLAGQHGSVLIKQMADIRTGARHNATMYPFAAVLADPQDLADLAAYLEALCLPGQDGRYTGPDAAQQVATGKALYESECSVCHGQRGEGSRHRQHPAIAGQHHAYLFRQMTDIRDGKRRNSSPEMLKVISRYDDHQLLAISAYQASLPMPGRMCRERTPAERR
jgi:cytochrome c553